MLLAGNHRISNVAAPHTYQAVKFFPLPIKFQEKSALAEFRGQGYANGCGTPIFIVQRDHLASANPLLKMGIIEGGFICLWLDTVSPHWVSA